MKWPYNGASITQVQNTIFWSPSINLMQSARNVRKQDEGRNILRYSGRKFVLTIAKTNAQNPRF